MHIFYLIGYIEMSADVFYERDDTLYRNRKRKNGNKCFNKIFYCEFHSINDFQCSLAGTSAVFVCSK